MNETVYTTAGDLTVLTEGSVDAAIEESIRDLAIPYFDVHDRPASELTFDVAHLDAT